MPLMKQAIHETQNKTASFNAVAFVAYRLGTLGANCTITLPASPALDDLIAIAAPLDLSTYTCTLSGNGKNINGAASLALSAGKALMISYDGAQWRIVAGHAGSGAFVLMAGGGLLALTNPAGIAQAESATNKVNTLPSTFTNGVSSYEDWGLLPMPADWDGGSVAVEIVWSATSASTNPAVWSFQAEGYASGASIDAAWSAVATVTQANAGSDKVNKALIPTVTLAGTLSAGCPAAFRVGRLNDVADTLAAVANLHYVRIIYGRMF